MLNNIGMGFVFTARDLASAKLRLLERNFTSLDRTSQAGAARISASFRRIAIGLGALTAGGLAVGGAFALAGRAGPFEQGLAAVGAVTRATTGELGMLRDAAVRAGIATQFSPDEAVGGLQSLATAGQTAAQATATLIPVLDLAAGSLGQLGVAEAADAVVGTLNAYGLAAEQATGVTDQLLRITQLTNFQARDFEAGLAKAAATGAVFSQSLDDVLIGMGLLRNRNIDASSSATAFREAVRRVGSDQRAQNALIGAGVKVFDEHTGRMRSILDIMSDFAARTRTMSEAERNARVNMAFGARGLLAFNAAMNAAFTTTKGGVQVTLQGAEAIAALRQQIAQAEGTAAGFRARMLDTFEGQKTLLRGIVQTLFVVLGEPFAKVLKPVVQVVANALNTLIRAFQAIPAPVKQAFAAFVVVAGAAIALVGALAVAKASLALFVIGLKLLGVTLGGVLATMLPALLLFGLLATAVTGFVIAVRRDIGGLGTFFQRSFERVRLFVRAMSQLFEQGGFSGAVRAELGRADSQGVKTFAIRIFQVVFRLQRFFAGIGAGFRTAIEGAQVVFFRLAEALRHLAEAFGAAGTSIDAVAGLGSDRFADAGAGIGAVLGRIALLMTKLLTAGVRVATGIIEGFRSMGGFLREVFGFLGAVFGELGTELRALLQEIGLLGPETRASGNMALSVGQALGKVLGGLVATFGLALAGAAQVVRIVVRLARNVGESLGRLAAGLVQLFIDPVEGIKNLLGGLVGILVSLGNAVLSLFGVHIEDIQGLVDDLGRGLALFFTETIPGWVRRGLAAVGDLFVRAGRRILGFFTESIPRAFRSIVDAVRAFFAPVVELVQHIFKTLMNAIDRMIAFLGQVAARIPSRFRPELLDTVVAAGEAATTRMAQRERARATATPGPLAPLATTAAVPAAAEARARGLADEQLAQALVAQGVAATEAAARASQRPIHVRLEVDGETLARTTAYAQREAALRRFAPLPGT